MCKHYGLSFNELEDVDLGSYLCLLAESLDAEELDNYNYAVMTAIAFNNPKQLKKWQWSSKDKAGTAARGVDQVQNQLINFGKEVFKRNIDVEKVNRNPTRAMEFARITGRRILFMNPDGFLFDEAAQVVKDYDPQSLVINVDYEGNFV